MRLYGLIGFPLGHSRSAEYFTQKFEREHIDAEYRLFEIPDIGHLTALPAGIEGFNVTIPYKQAIIPHLDDIDAEALAVGAVNCVVCRCGAMKGYNTDIAGIRHTLDRMPCFNTSRALILGSGGASRAVQYVLSERGVAFDIVSRSAGRGNMTYGDLEPGMMDDYMLIINTTPAGMYPHTNEAPALPYEALKPHHILFDAIYNPAQTLFLQHGQQAGAYTVNGMGMFVAQAEASWRIWNDAQCLRR